MSEPISCMHMTNRLECPHCNPRIYTAAEAQQMAVEAAGAMREVCVQIGRDFDTMDGKDFHWKYGQVDCEPAIRNAPFPADSQKWLENRCQECGGPHSFDISVPSDQWNAVIRAKGLPEFLCLTCIVQEFVKAGKDLSAELWGESFNGTPITVSSTLTCQLAEARLDEAKWWFGPVDHLRSCSFGVSESPDGDICDCGLRQRRRQRDARIAQLEAAALGGGVT